MAVVIRLSRTGKTHNISYRIQVQDKWSKRDGKFLENLGFYNPFYPKDQSYKLNREKYDFWLSKGAKPSQAVLELVEGNGTRPPRPKKPRKDTKDEQSAGQQVSESVSQKTGESESKEAQEAPVTPTDLTEAPKSTDSTESPTH